MNTVNYFWDLENITSYTSHYVRCFDVNTPSSGGGVFRWISASNVSITNIPGIRIKPLGTTDGYWVREYSGAIHIDWFGVRNTTATLNSLGITQPVADARYGAGLVNVSTDTYDTAAIKYAFKLMETPGYGSVEFSERTYYVGSAISLPRFQTGVTVPIFNIRGNGAIISNTPAFTGTIFTRIPPSQNAALNGGYVSSRFFIDGLSFKCSGITIALRLGPSFGSEIKNIEFTGVDYGIYLEFCLQALVQNVKGIPESYGIYLDYGAAWGGTSSDSQCNHTRIVGCRMYNAVGAIASYYIRGASGVEVIGSIVEGNPPQYGVYFDSALSAVVKDFTVDNTHIETACSVAGIYIRAADGQYVINRVFNQYAQTLIEFDVPVGYPQLNVSNISYTHPSTKFANKNAGGVWKFSECNLGEAPWQSSPSAIHPYNSSAWIVGGAYFQPQPKYNNVHVLQPNYRCYVIDPVLRQLTDD